MKNTLIAATIATTALLTASPEAKAQNNGFQIVSADPIQNGHNQNGHNQNGHNQNGHNQNGHNQNGHNHNQNGHNHNQNGHNHNQNGHIQNGNQNQFQNGQIQNGQIQNGQIQNGHIQNGNQNQFQNGNNQNQNQRYVVSRTPLANLVEPILLRSTPAGDVYKWVTYSHVQLNYSDGSVDYESEEISTSFVDPNQQQSQPQIVSRVELNGFTERFYSHTIPSRLTPAGEHVYKWVTFRVFQVTYSDGHTEKEQIEVSTSWVDPNSPS